MDWYQQLGTVNLQFFTRGGYPQTRVMLFPSHRDLTVKVKQGNLFHVTHLLLEGNVLWPCKVKTNYDSGVVEVYLTKETPGIWHSLGEREEDDGTKTEVQQQQQHYDSMEVVSVSAVAHNTKLIILRHKNRIMDAIPIGYSVPVLAYIDGTVFKCSKHLNVAMVQYFFCRLDVPPLCAENLLHLLVFTVTIHISPCTIFRHQCTVHLLSTCLISRYFSCLHLATLHF